MTFRNAAVVGTGMMGPGIAVTLALGGVSPTILSRTEKSARKGLESARRQLLILEEHGIASKAQANWAIENITAHTGFEDAVGQADIVIESAPENLAFKQELFERLDGLSRPEAVLASNTSALSITAIASRCRHPERIMTTHFWNPPHLMPLVEIVKGEHTSDTNASAVADLLRACGKTPVIVHKDRPGQLGNRLQMALVREAINIVQEGIASVEDVDLAAKYGFGLRLPAYGIFEHQDAVGLDMCLGIVDYVAQDLFNEPNAPDYMRELVAQGHFGAKSGKGFYDWSIKDIDGVKALRDRFILEFVSSSYAPRKTKSATPEE